MRVYICPDATNFDELQFPPGPPGTGFVMPIGTAQDDEEAERGRGRPSIRKLEFNEESIVVASTILEGKSRKCAKSGQDKLQISWRHR